MDDIDKAISEIKDLKADHPVFRSMTGPEAWKKALDVCVGILTKLKAKAEVAEESCDTVSQKHIPQEWAKEYVDKLIDMAKQFAEHSPMHVACLLRADHVMDMVKAFRESEERNDP